MSVKCETYTCKKCGRESLCFRDSPKCYECLKAENAELFAATRKARNFLVLLFNECDWYDDTPEALIKPVIDSLGAVIARTKEDKP
jgi:hypothetical protein